MIFRAFITQIRQMVGGRFLSEDTLGVHDEVFDAEVYQPYGFSSNPEEGGETLAFDVLNDPDHRMLLPPRADEDGFAELGTTKIYYGPDTKIVLSEDKIIIVRGDYTATIEGDTLKTNLNIHTSANATIDGDLEVCGSVKVKKDVDVKGDVKADEVEASGVKLTKHKHKAVKSGTDISGTPV